LLNLINNDLFFDYFSDGGSKFTVDDSAGTKIFTSTSD
jgi:hypothetical protein